MDKQQLEEIYNREQERFIEEWKELLRFESISTDPEYNQACLDCAEWTLAHLESIGFKGELLETKTKPVVFAEYVPNESKGVVSFYGHYDVQPVDPVELWESPPFEPTLREGRLYARGAQDNKGQLFYMLKALETLIKNDALSVTVRVFIEGEEECQSPGMEEAMPGWKDKLKSDVLLVCDTGTTSKDISTVTMGLRGVLSLSMKMYGPNKDLHSGMHGGVAPNPAQGVCELLATLHKEDGSVAVEGFYDGIEEIPEVDRKAAEAGTLTEEVYEQMIGVKPLGGEKGYSLPIRRGLRPTLEVNGVVSGYGGAGSKTVIPSEAVGKLTARLVAGQDPKKILESTKAHILKHCPPGFRIEFDEENAIGGALRLSMTSDAIKKAGEALTKLDEGEVAYLWEGASVPIIGTLAEIAEADAVLVGFALEEDNIHAPNESFAVDQFRKGFLFAGLFLQDCIS